MERTAGIYAAVITYLIRAIANSLIDRWVWAKMSTPKMSIPKQSIIFRMLSNHYYTCNNYYEYTQSSKVLDCLNVFCKGALSNFQPPLDLAVSCLSQ